MDLIPVDSMKLQNKNDKLEISDEIVGIINNSDDNSNSNHTNNHTNNDNSDNNDNKRDANDYSRFDNVSDEESPEETKSDKPEEEIKLSLPEALSRANGYKDAGNSAFKRNEYVEAGQRYQEGVSILKAYKDVEEVKISLIALHGNNAMVLLKCEDYMQAIVSASEVLLLEKDNVKALFRRGVSYYRSGSLEESKADLSRVLELDSDNTPAKKVLKDLLKTTKEFKTKEKFAFSSMFNKTMYGDREIERIAKLKREEIEKQKEQDEWVQSKLSRREIGLDEQSFDEWKKDKDEEIKKIKENNEKDSKNNTNSNSNKNSDTTNTSNTSPTASDPIPRSINKKSEDGSNKDDDDDMEYDEEDTKILSDAKKKGYCYFKNEQSSEIKALIGDITPKAFNSNTQLSNNQGEEGGEEGVNEGMKQSSWNHAGTWEEKDMTQFSRDRLTALCLEAAVSQEFDMSDPQSLALALDAMKSTLDPSAPSSSSTNSNSDINSNSNVLEQLEASMSSVSACVTGTKTVEGEAQIVLARGKKRHIYDFNVTLEFEVIVKPSPLGGGFGGEGGEEKIDNKKNKKYTGTLQIPEITPNTPFELTINFKKNIPPHLTKKINDITDKLKDEIFNKLKTFETEFKNM